MCLATLSVHPSLLRLLPLLLLALVEAELELELLLAVGVEVAGRLGALVAAARIEHALERLVQVQRQRQGAGGGVALLRRERRGKSNAMCIGVFASCENVCLKVQGSLTSCLEIQSARVVNTPNARVYLRQSVSVTHLLLCFFFLKKSSLRSAIYIATRLWYRIKPKFSFYNQMQKKLLICLAVRLYL